LLRLVLQGGGEVYGGDAARLSNEDVCVCIEAISVTMVLYISLLWLLPLLVLVVGTADCSYVRWCCDGQFQTVCHEGSRFW
jgi:hypothetical protein